METFGVRVKKRRKEMGMTQVQLAKRSGLSQATISDLENDKLDIDRIEAQTLLRIAAALEANPAWLRTGTGPETYAEITPDLDQLIAIWSRLPASRRAALVATANALDSSGIE